MPYITMQRRQELTDPEKWPQNAGELNYLFTLLCKGYFIRKGDYQAINDVLGALEACKLEFYRRVVVPYEDQKIKENGDVY